jgi:hypothetical protein
MRRNILAKLVAGKLTEEYVLFKALELSPHCLLAAQAETVVTITDGPGKRKPEPPDITRHYVGWRERKHFCSFQSQEECFFLTLPFRTLASSSNPMTALSRLRS